MKLRARSAAKIVSIVMVLLPLSNLPAGAQARPDARTMACIDVRELVFGKGAVVITTGERTFARFVESQLFCQPVAEISTPAFVETRDNPECWIGYVCRNRSDLNK
jgi:hypothetical protein